MKYNMKRSNRTIALIVTILLLASAFGGIFYGINKKGPEVAAAQEPLITQTQAMNGADKNIAFEFITKLS